MKKYYIVSLAIIIIVSIAPLVPTVMAVVIAGHYGCKMDEGSIYPCIIHGHDYGDTLYGMGICFWLSIVTLPIGGVSLILWVVTLIAHLVTRRY